jgi:hypothetical protein
MKDSKYKALENGDSLFKNLDNFAESFAGNPYVGTEILRLGWLAWEDEIELEKNQKLIEAVGAGYGGEVNAIKANLPGCTTVRRHRHSRADRGASSS